MGGVGEAAGAHMVAYICFGRGGSRWGAGRPSVTPTDALPQVFTDQTRSAAEKVGMTTMLQPVLPCRAMSGPWADGQAVDADSACRLRLPPALSRSLSHYSPLVGLNQLG